MKKITLLTLVLTFFAFLANAQSPSKNIPAAQFYEGGQEAMYKFINEHKIYPATAKRNRMQGECVVAFELNEDGSTASHRIVKNVGGGTGEEALRVVKLLKFKAAGYKQQLSIPVIFKL
jgi:protein TonB